METKSAPLTEIKTNSTAGEFTAVIAAIGNVDRQGDRVMPMAFKNAIELDPIPPCYWAHRYDIPPIGEGLDWKELGNEVHYSGRLFVSGDDDHQYAKMVYAGMKSMEGRTPAIREFSYTYGLPEDGAERVFEDGKSIRNLLDIRPVAEVGPCFVGANPLSRLAEAAKAADLALEPGTEFVALAGVSIAPEFDFFQLTKNADWSEEYVNDLPDSAFLHIGADGHKDETGKTAPRSHRQFAFKNAEGRIDMPSLRKAIDMAPQAEALDEEVRGRIQERAQRILRSQEGKALLLGTIYSTKCWEDIEGYAVRQLLSMLDYAVSYIQTEEDMEDVSAMQTIATSLLALLDRDFTKVAADSSAKSALAMATDLYKSAAHVETSSDAPLTVTKQDIARLLTARPTH